jgi:hypothetical protein
MELLSQNKAASLTTFSVNTGTAKYLFDRLDSSFIGSMATTTATTLTATWTDDGATFDRVVLQNINWKSFSIKNNGTALSLDTTFNDTSTADFTGNSETSLVLKLVSTTALDTSLIIAVSSNTAASLNHSADQIWFCDLHYTFDQNPTAKDYKPKINRKEYVHRLADGGTAQFVLNSYFEAAMKINFITQSMTTALETVYNLKREISFIPFPTSASWQGQIFTVIWTGPFDFRYANNNLTAGYSGSIKLSEAGK